MDPTITRTSTTASSSLTSQPSTCILQGLIYQPGTLIPVTTRYGPEYQLYNHRSKSVVPLDPENGTARLEEDGIYVVMRKEIVKVCL